MEKIDLRSQMAAGVESGEIRPTSSTVSPRHLTKNLYNIITQGESLFICLLTAAAQKEVQKPNPSLSAYVSLRLSGGFCGHKAFVPV